MTGTAEIPRAGASVTPNGAAGRARVTVGPGYGWTSHRLPASTVHLTGYLHDGSKTLTGAAAADRVAATLSRGTDDAGLIDALTALEGHFAVVVESPDRTLAIVDRVASIPLLHAERDGVVHIDSRGRRLRGTLQLDTGDIDAGQALAVAMSGYTIGAATLYRPIRRLRAGEALLVDAAGSRTLRWSVYDAWRPATGENAAERLRELNMLLVERLAASAQGRMIAIPLSAGLDSRLIASGLRHLGVRDVRLFSYGVPGNREAETAKVIAERLGYPWTFVPYSHATQRVMFADSVHEAELWGAADALCATPFEQDWRAISRLKASGFIAGDAIVVNGQSGDFIAGNHAPLALIDGPEPPTPEARQAAVAGAILAKHYRLWRSLATPEADGHIVRLLLAEARAAGASFAGGEALAGLCEMLELQDRQSKYVVSGQRTYEALGLEWRLPLWDDAYMAFWRRLPFALKRRQQLYRDTLVAQNWAGVWQSVPVNPQTIRPRWIIPARWALKALTAPAGRGTWHKVERQVFGWWLDPLCNTSVVPYRAALLDRRGARGMLSWLTERYLKGHGVLLDRLPPLETAPDA